MSRPKDGDSTTATDEVHAGLVGYVPPVHPCPQCKGESKDSGIKGWRVCCGKQLYIGLTEKEHLELLEDLAGAKARVVQFEIMYKAADKELTEALRQLRERGII